MSPVQLIREVPAQVPSWFWKVVAGAALCSLMTVVLLAWQGSRQPRRVVTVELPSLCGVAR